MKTIIALVAIVLIAALIKKIFNLTGKVFIWAICIIIAYIIYSNLTGNTFEDLDITVSTIEQAYSNFVFKV